MAQQGILSRRKQRSDSPDLEGLDSSARKRSRMSKVKLPCALCCGLFSEQGLKDLNSQDGFTHHTRSECVASKSQGCPLCQLFFEVVRSNYGEDWEEDDRLVFRNASSKKDSPPPYIDVLQCAVHDRADIMNIFLFAKAGNPASALVHRRPLRRNVQSNAVFSAARRLINSCMGRQSYRDEGHQQCRYSRDTVLPTRVIDLGDPEDPQSVLHLQVNETETHGAYLALSYCWGETNSNAEVKPTQLRRDSVQDLVSEIKVENLQQSIQDAITVTRKLGFRYLWVDALCIIQDDSEDQSHEISKMSAIYKNAAITVAAGVAEKASDGFLHGLSKNTAAYLPDCMVDIPMRENHTGRVYFSAHPYEPDHPLDKRGWVLQEFMLSSRMLIFSDYELLWQCKETPLQSVTGTVGGLEYIQPLESLPWAVFDDDAEPYFGSLDFDKVYLWKTIIQQYTDRDLTHKEDRLPAVLGIISELEKLWRDPNIYGHWKKWFVQLLAWYKPIVKRAEKRHLHRAPSWSWVSVDGEILYEEPLEVEDAKVKTVTFDEVILTCRILGCDDIADDKIDSVVERPDLDDSSTTREFGDKEYHYLLLGKTRVENGCEKGVGLVLLPTSGRQYRRVGLVVFGDLTIWKGVEPQDIMFEPKRK